MESFNNDLKADLDFLGSDSEDEGSQKGDEQGAEEIGHNDDSDVVKTEAGPSNDVLRVAEKELLQKIHEATNVHSIAKLYHSKRLNQVMDVSQSIK
jgi:hypothetical protein